MLAMNIDRFDREVPLVGGASIGHWGWVKYEAQTLYGVMSMFASQNRSVIQEFSTSSLSDLKLFSGILRL